MFETIVGVLDNRSNTPVRVAVVDWLPKPISFRWSDWVAAGSLGAVGWAVPWAPSAAAFGDHHMEIQVGDRVRWWLWQADRADGDHVRFSLDSSWDDPGMPVRGVHDVDLANSLRTLVVRDGCFELVGLPQAFVSKLRVQLGTGGFRLVENVRPRDRVASRSRRRAAATSIAGPPSDAWRMNQPGARFLYRDEGKRYQFSLRGGVAVAVHPDGRETSITQAVSYNRLRRGEPIDLPVLDQIAADGGRLLAKEAGVDRFYFATMDETFIHVGDDGREIAPPSTFFKLDPQFNQPGASHADLLAHFRGCSGGHPATERFPFFEAIENQQLVDMMLTPLRAGVWHLLDDRPPMTIVDIVLTGIKWMLLDLPPVELVTRQIPELQRLLALLDQALPLPVDTAPPQHPQRPYPTYIASTFEKDGRRFEVPAVDFDEVLDLGVGHGHWHENYDGTTGGEMQAMMAGPLVPGVALTFADMYRFVNGPIADGDGFIDGTANFYALVHLRGTDRYALLYADEQLYFTHRWRIADPDDRSGMLLSITAAIGGLLGYPFRYDPNVYWCPFRAKLIRSYSRLAVSRQVALVTSFDPRVAEPDPAATATTRYDGVVYSTNFSYSSMDRSWRWRKLPAKALNYRDDAAEADEAVDANQADVCYPQTIELREDMSICIKGASAVPGGAKTVGRWCQRYLPAGNVLVPSADRLNGNMPADDYRLPWRFYPENVFAAADRFSRLGVYDAVDSRVQYYEVQPGSAADDEALMYGSGDPAPWVDTGYVLQSRMARFRWAGVGVSLAPKKPPSIFNPHTYLRIVRRRDRWIAVHWDKRDDDLLPFADLPVRLTLHKGARSATVTLQSHRRVDAPPAVQRAEVAFTGEQQRPLSMALTNPQRVWRVRMAALSLTSGPSTTTPTVTMLVDVSFDRHFSTGPDTVARSSLSPGSRTLSLLTQYCTPAGASGAGTSLWVEDELGRVAVPDQIVWSGIPAAAPSDGRLWHTIRQPTSWTAIRDATALLRPPGPVVAVATAGTPGQAHVLYTTANGDVYHAIRSDNGSWSPAGDVKGQIGNPGVVIGVAAAAASSSETHFLLVTRDGRVWHTLRRPDRWTAHGDVKSQIGDPGHVVAVAGAPGAPGELHCLFATNEGGLWHTIRRDNGWQPARDVKGSIGDRGAVVAVAAASNGSELHVLYATHDGRLWHTIRRADQTWDPSGDVNGQIGDPGRVVTVAAAASGDGDVHFAMATASGGLFHTIRRATGWSPAGDVKGQIGNPGRVSALAAVSTARQHVQIIFTT